MRKHLDINKPSQTEVEKYLKLWDSLENTPCKKVV
jgi:hypothetical protein